MVQRFDCASLQFYITAMSQLLYAQKDQIPSLPTNLRISDSLIFPPIYEEESYFLPIGAGTECMGI